MDDNECDMVFGPENSKLALDKLIGFFGVDRIRTDPEIRDSFNLVLQTGLYTQEDVDFAQRPYKTREGKRGQNGESMTFFFLGSCDNLKKYKI